MRDTLVPIVVGFVLGACAVLAVRVALHRPDASAPEPMSVHAAAHPVAEAVPAAAVPVNTVCALCGMPVDPAIPTASYHGRTIGFGCRACPPRFAADPGRYGPAALRDEVVE